MQLMRQKRAESTGSQPSRYRVETARGNGAYAWAMGSVAIFGLIGLGAALLLPAKPERQPMAT